MRMLLNEIAETLAPLDLSPAEADHCQIAGTSGQWIRIGEDRAVTCPVLVIRGSASEVFDPDAAAEFVAALPDGHLETMPDANHNVHSSKTARFLDAVRPFLAELG